MKTPSKIEKIDFDKFRDLGSDGNMYVKTTELSVENTLKSNEHTDALNYLLERESEREEKEHPMLMKKFNELFDEICGTVAYIPASEVSSSADLKVCQKTKSEVMKYFIKEFVCTECNPPVLLHGELRNENFLKHLESFIENSIDSVVEGTRVEIALPSEYNSLYEDPRINGMRVVRDMQAEKITKALS